MEAPECDLFKAGLIGWKNSKSGRGKRGKICACNGDTLDKVFGKITLDSALEMNHNAGGGSKTVSQKYADNFKSF